MNRTSIIAAAAITTLIGCAEESPEMSADALAVNGFMGITPTLDIVPMSNEFTPPAESGPTNSIWAAADVPAGSYWMTVDHVAELEGNASATAGERQLTFVTEDNGMPLLLGMAPIMSSGENLNAQYVDLYTAPLADGRCTVTTTLMADGIQTGPESFEMFVYFEDSVVGEDCEKLGFGPEKFEAAAFDATFDYIPTVLDDGSNEEPGADPSNI